MRLQQISVKQSIHIFIYGLSIIFLVQVFLSFPIFGFTGLNIVRLIVGVIALFLLNNVYRSRCLCVSALVSGVAGFLYIGLLYLDCFVGNILGSNGCFSIQTEDRLKALAPRLYVAILMYFLLLMIGLIWMKWLRLKR